MTEVVMLVGKQSAGNGSIVRIAGRFKQFLASLNGAEVGETAVVEIYTTPDSDTAKGIKIATVELSGAEPSAISPVIECLAANYFGKVVSVDGGAVWLTGVNE